MNEIKDATWKFGINESEIIRQLKDIVLENVDRMLSISDTIKVTALLDPPLQKAMIIDENGNRLIDEADGKGLLRVQAEKAVKRLNFIQSSLTSANLPIPRTSSSSGTTTMGTTQTAVIAASSSSSVRDLKTRLIEKYSTNTNKASSTKLNKLIKNEVNAFMSMDVTTCTGSPLLFWKKHQMNFLNLSVLARNYLTLSASSVAVESMFSVAGHILNSKRSSMSPYRAHMLSFMTIMASFIQ